MMSLQVLDTAEGFTQASIVMLEVKCKDEESGTSTRELTPLNTRAFPNFEAFVQVALLTVPLFPLPDRSVTVFPEPSSKEYAATNPGIVASVVVVAILE